ncbi:MAG: DUF4179 domain-containing protein [Eubacteriales bacterium]|nr:DUF4179 domain-containing protein [Eubacteriales bacterium]
MTFDDKLKARAAREDSPAPAGFDSRMDALLGALPAQAAPPVRKRRPLRVAVCAAAAATLIVGASAAAPAVLEMTQHVIDYFRGQDDSAYATRQMQYERYSAAVGASRTVDGTTLTIDDLAVDDSYMTVFYTMTGEAPLERLEGDEPESWLAEWSAPVFWAMVDGKELDSTGTIQTEAYFADDCTLKGMHRLPIKTALPDRFDLLLYTGGTSSLPDADFRFALAVDKSTVDSLTVEPKQDFTVRYTWTDEQGAPHTATHTPRIERVSVSPLSSSLTLSERVTGDDMPWDSFVLRDDQGNYLPLIDGGLTGNSIGRSVNQFEFIGADETTRSITLIPIAGNGRSHEVRGALDALPLTDAGQNGLTLETLAIGADKAVATFSTHGVTWRENGRFSLTDADGDRLAFDHNAYFDSYTDRETGNIIATLYYPDLTEEALAQVAGVSFWQPDDIELLEEQAVTIALR